MKLYHGTNHRHLDAILKGGLKPRSRTRHSNWKHSVESSPDAVYLTLANAIFFGWQACSPKGPDKVAIIEIETDTLIHDRLIPDEDAIEQIMRRQHDQGGFPDDMDMNARTAYIRDNIHDFVRQGFTWESSLRANGNCAYEDTITPASFEKVAIIDLDKLGSLGKLTLTDVSISVMAWQIVKDQRIQYNEMIFGYPLTPIEEGNPLRPVPIPGLVECVEIITL